jgi:hypothetical protein
MADDPRGREYAMNHGHHKVACGELAFWRVSIMRPIGGCGFSPQALKGEVAKQRSPRCTSADARAPELPSIRLLEVINRTKIVAETHSVAN